MCLNNHVKTEEGRYPAWAKMDRYIAYLNSHAQVSAVRRDNERV